MFRSDAAEASRTLTGNNARNARVHIATYQTLTSKARRPGELCPLHPA
jgi:hypothetical protein